jgi:hypothetical protein
MHINFKIVKFISLYFARHVSDTTVSIIRSISLLPMQPLVPVWRCVGCFLQPCSVVTAAFAAPDDGHSGVRNMLSKVE